jgi:hypothetical protein
MANFPIMFSFTSHHIISILCLSVPPLLPFPTCAFFIYFNSFPSALHCCSHISLQTLHILLPFAQTCLPNVLRTIATLASLSRGPTMPNNPEMSKFLYTIVKQLDLKSVGVPSLLSFGTTLLSSRCTRRKISRFLCLEVSPHG